ncbi:uncharacterized protein LOC141731733 [Zonotrichia albicollis]|uniref:uncharacterized protein LOC141731733 n=1 Tax=Zonotrichia albicollis TaxID=44394 RepID=UPI003D80D5B1
MWNRPRSPKTAGIRLRAGRERLLRMRGTPRLGAWGRGPRRGRGGGQRKATPTRPRSRRMSPAPPPRLTPTPASEPELLRGEGGDGPGRGPGPAPPPPAAAPRAPLEEPGAPPPPEVTSGPAPSFPFPLGPAPPPLAPPPALAPPPPDPGGFSRGARGGRGLGGGRVRRGAGGVAVVPRDAVRACAPRSSCCRGAGRPRRLPGAAERDPEGRVRADLQRAGQGQAFTFIPERVPAVPRAAPLVPEHLRHARALPGAPHPPRVGGAQRRHLCSATWWPRTGFGVAPGAAPTPPPPPRTPPRPTHPD